MDFQLSEEQRAFADMAQGLFADFCGDEQLRAHDLSDAPMMGELWAQCVAAGLHTVLVPEAQGGLGLGMTEMLAVLEQQGRALAAVPLWEQQLTAAALARYAQASCAALIESALKGELLSLSLSGLSASRGPALRLDHGLLQGHVAAVPLADVAGHALLVAQDAAGRSSLVVVELGQSGVSRTVGRSQHHQGLADLGFAGVAPLAVLPAEALAWVEQRALACAAALQLGVTQQQLKRTVEYVSERQQFGRPIGSFQLVAGQMADSYIACEALRASLWQLVWRLDAGRDSVPQAHATRALANELGHFAGHKAQHVHGGMGVDVSYPMHRFLYWSRALGAQLGGSEHHLAQLGDWLADHDTLGWKYDLPEDL